MIGKILKRTIKIAARAVLIGAVLTITFAVYMTIEHHRPLVLPLFPHGTFSSRTNRMGLGKLNAS